MSRRFIWGPIFGFIFFVTFLPASTLSKTGDTQQPPSSVELSHVRVVRLSFVEGTVTTRRTGSSEWSSAMLNSPIQEGFSVATEKSSFAEVEFENGSTLRIGELSVINFKQLALTPEGGHINHLALEKGYATFNVIPERHDEYLLNVADVSVESRGKAQFRTDLNENGVRVEVFDGHVQATDSNHTESLGKNHALIRDDEPNSAFQVTEKIQKDDWDKWADARQQQSALAVNNEAISPNAPIYGWGDLDVYGEWSYLPGYGNGWLPYEPAGWSPYSAGMWDWYQGMGYTWVSAEPWGWLPFHYGYWNFSPGTGWFWMPGAGSFGAWNPALVNWYSGPGWVGWSPIGAAGIGGGAPCTLAVSGCLTAVVPSTLTGRRPIRPGDPNILHPTSIGGVAAIARPAMLPDRPSASAGVDNFSPGHSSVRTSGAAPALGRLSAFALAHGTAAAPSSIIMGRHVNAETFAGHHSTFGNAFRDREPLRVRLGSTLGGQFPVRNVASGLEGFRNPTAQQIRGGPQILSRGSNPGAVSGGYASRGASSMRGGGSAGSGAGVSHGGGSSSGGNSGGASSGGGHH